MTDDTTYREKIQDMLIKVSSNEQVFEPKKIDVIGHILKQDGVKKGIQKIFSTNEILTENIDNEISEIGGDNGSVVDNNDIEFELVSSVQDVPAVAPIWQRALMQLRRLGQSIDESPTYIVRNVQYGDEVERVTVKLARNPHKPDVPYMMVSFGGDDDNTPAELAIPYIQDLGIKINRASMYEPPKGDVVYFEFSV